MSAKIDWLHHESITKANYCDTCGHQFSDICGGCETLDGVPIKYDDKPPIGIMPRYIHNSNRMVEILDAMERYSKSSRSIPVEWVVELKDLINNLMGEWLKQECTDG